MTIFAHSQTTNKLVNEAANDFARVGKKDRKIPPALGTNHTAGFGGFRPLASLEKINYFVLCTLHLCLNLCPFQCLLVLGFCLPQIVEP